MAKQIPLTHGKFATVDDEDYEWAKEFDWYAHRKNGKWYAARDVGHGRTKRRIYLHDEIVSRLPKEKLRKMIAEMQEREKWQNKLN